MDGDSKMDALRLLNRAGHRYARWIGQCRMLSCQLHLSLFLILVQITGQATAHAAHVRIIEGDREALTFRLDLIEHAQREIFVAAYMVGDDPASLKLLAAMRSAARRGVDVRVIVDGHRGDNLMPKSLMAHLISQGVAVREHMPDVRYKMELGRQRMHDKLFIVDGQHLIIGGRNQRSDFYGLAQRNYLDRELYLLGTATTHARSYYQSRWCAATTGVPSLQRDEHPKVAEQQQMRHLNDLEWPNALACAALALDEAEQAPVPEAACIPIPLAAELEVCDCSIRFVHDIPCGEKDDPAAIASQLTAVIDNAQRCILMESPYLVFTHAFRKSLRAARERGVEICIVTNSLATTDHDTVHAQYANERRWLRDLGIQLWEYKGDRVLHAKGLVVDEFLVMVGSYNFDVLSETRNSEVALLIKSQELARQTSSAIANQLEESIPVPAEGSLIHFDARTNDLDPKDLRAAQIKRLISPWIKRYL